MAYSTNYPYQQPATSAPWTNSSGAHTHTTKAASWTNPSGAHTHTISSQLMGGVPAWPPQKQPFWTNKVSKDHRGLLKLQRAVDRANQKEETKPYYRSVPTGLAVEHLGKVRPIHGGRPTNFAMALLNAAASPVRIKTAHLYSMLFVTGLVYRFPSVYRRRKVTHRLSAVGLNLLDHYATEWPSFAKFVDCYASKKARSKILEDCVDLELGHIPVEITRLIEADEKAKEKHRADEFTYIKNYLASQLNQHVNTPQVSTIGDWNIYTNMLNRTYTVQSLSTGQNITLNVNDLLSGTGSVNNLLSATGK